MTIDVSAPVTHAELRQELSKFKTELKTELKIDLDERFRTFGDALLVSVKELLAAMEGRLMTELGRHTRASAEDLATQVASLDDKYTDLPGRVTRLEEAVFLPRPAPRRRPARRGRAR